MEPPFSSYAETRKGLDAHHPLGGHAAVTQYLIQTVQQRCAARGMSLSLRGFNTVPRGWYMVVMDLLEEYECFYHVKHSLSRKKKERLREELRSKLTDPH